MIQANTNNRWARLSQSEKAELLGIYTKHGYNDLAKIISHYNTYADGGPYGVIPLGGDYLTYLQTTPEVSGGMIEPSVVTAALPAKFNGSQAAAARYAEGYQKGAKPVSEAMNRAGQDIFRAADTVAGFIPGPIGMIDWLGHMGADAAEGNWGKVGRDVALATALGAGARSVSWLRNYVNDATNFGEDVFRAFTDRVPGRVSTNFTYSAPATRATMEAVPAASKAISAPYEIENLGGGYMLKSLMRGNPLEKQISKNGTVNVNNVKAIVGKGSKVEQAVVDKVLASEEFAGKKSIDYNKFRKAVQDELITYERTPNTGWANYGINRLGITESEDLSHLRNIERFAQSDRFEVVSTDTIGQARLWRDKTTGDILNWDGVTQRYLGEHDVINAGPGLNTFTFSSSRIPHGSSKHYDPNTLGHSRTYTTADEPDVLHVMESQSDWAQEGLKPQNHFFNSKGEDITDIVRSSWTAERKTPIERMYDYDSRIYVFGDTPEERVEFDKLTEEYNKLNERIQASSDFNPDDFLKQRELKERLDKIATTPYEGEGRARGRLGVSKKTPHLRPGLEERIVSPGTQETYLANNYTSRQIQENLRYAAEKGQTKMRYPTRDTAAKIEGYSKSRSGVFELEPELRARYDDFMADRQQKVNDIIREFAPEGYIDDYLQRWEEIPDEAIEVMSEAQKADLQRRSKLSWDFEKSEAGAEMKMKINEVYRKYDERQWLNENVPATYLPEHETILRKYDAFPKQYQKLYKGADVRTVTDPKGNTWYEVDVPEGYLQQEWAYENGGYLFGDGGSIHIKPENRGKFTALKKRTGHSASWFKAHGTPAQKKMAVFALNARKWKHADGGPLAITSQYIRDPQVQPRIETVRLPDLNIKMPEANIETPISFDLAPELYNMVPLMYDIPTITVPFISGQEVEQLDPVKDAARRIRAVENSKTNPNGGWNEKEKRWYPHKSVEGGADTIAYGIKLSNGTPEAELAKKQGYLTDDQAIHFTDSLAQVYYDKAKSVYDKKYGDGEWDKLSPESQSFLTDFSYNPGLGKFPKLMEGFHSGDIDMIRKNYMRYSNGKPLGRNKIMLGEIEKFGSEVPIFRKCGGKIKKYGGKIVQFDDFSEFF